MLQVVTELSYVDCLLVPVDAGFLVEVIRLGLWGIYVSWICCHLRCVWIVAIRCFVARFIQLRTNYIVISPVLSYCRLRSLSISVFFTLSRSLMFVFLDVSLGVFLCYVLLQWLDFLGSLFFLYSLSLPCQDVRTCCIISFGWFPGVWILCADVSEHSVCSIVIGGVSRKNNWDEIARLLVKVKVWLKIAWAIRSDTGHFLHTYCGPPLKGSVPSTAFSVFGHAPFPLPLLPIGSGSFEPNLYLYLYKYRSSIVWGILTGRYTRTWVFRCLPTTSEPWLRASTQS